MYYVGLDIHKKRIAFCIKDVSGKVQGEGSVPATRAAHEHWITTLPQPWTAAMEATLFTGWVYDRLLPHGGRREGGTSVDVAGHCRSPEEERSH
jgi:transposase